jgi:hypothetical protein
MRVRQHADPSGGRRGKERPAEVGCEGCDLTLLTSSCNVTKLPSALEALNLGRESLCEEVELCVATRLSRLLRGRRCSPFWSLSSLSMGACPPFSLRAIPLL